MKLYYVLLTSVLSMLAGGSCNDKNEFLLSSGLEFDLIVMDESQRESNIINEGTNFILALKAKNTSNQVIEFNFVDLCILFEVEDFFLVKKITEDEGTVIVGKPFDDRVVCNFLGYQKITLSGNSEKIVFGFQWYNNPNNKSIKPGRYFSKASFEFSGKTFSPYKEFLVQ